MAMYGRMNPSKPGFSRADQTADPDVLEKLEAAEEEKANNAKLWAHFILVNIKLFMAGIYLQLYYQ